MFCVRVCDTFNVFVCLCVWYCLVCLRMSVIVVFRCCVCVCVVCEDCVMLYGVLLERCLCLCL